MDDQEVYEVEQPATLNGKKPPREEPDLSDPEGFVTELSADTKFFEAQDIARVRIGQRIVTFKIASVSKEELEQAIMEARPKSLPRRRDRAGNLAIDDDSPQYRNWLLTYAYIKVLLSFRELTIRDKAGEVVWQRETGIRKTAPAIQALKEMGISTPQVDDLTKQIDALSQLDAQQEMADFLGT